jgi:hypothetical protein
MKRWCKAFIVEHVTRTSEASSVTSGNRPDSHQSGRAMVLPHSHRNRCAAKKVFFCAGLQLPSNLDGNNRHATVSEEKRMHREISVPLILRDRVRVLQDVLFERSLLVI